MRIDVFHDTVCPWCRIGKRHLQLALAEWDGETVEVQFHAFFLNPHLPPEGYPFREYLMAKGGGRISLEQWFAAPRAAGLKVGLTFHFEHIARAPNSRLSHELIALAPAHQQAMVIDALYKAYFEDGRDIGNLDTLVEIGIETGLDEAIIREGLQSGVARASVLASAEQAHRLGINGVPFFVVNHSLAFSGAQPPHIILDVLRQAQRVT